ncbi:hypothetical protein ACHWQZ_G004721 [Mnemiopsis leidyi]
MISFEVQGYDDLGIGRVDVSLGQEEDPYFMVEYCQDNKILTNLPLEDQRIWRFIKHGLEGISIECNNVEVGRHMFKDSTRLQDCQNSKWTSKGVARMNFIRATEASTGIRGICTHSLYQPVANWINVLPANSATLHGSHVTYTCVRPFTKMVGNGTVTCLWAEADFIYKVEGQLSCEIGTKHENKFELVHLQDCSH